MFYNYYSWWLVIGYRFLAIDYIGGIEPCFQNAIMTVSV